MLPNFICVGPGRAGTSWLYEMFLAHPQVCMAKDIKETQFFNENYEKGIAWYERLFDHCNRSNARGEISNRYIFDPKVPERIKLIIPDCKILICLRNPYQRIQSVYTFKLREGGLTCSFEDALIRMPELIEENRYSSLVKPYFDFFGKENLFIIYYEDLKTDPAKLCKKLFSFLGVKEDFIPKGAYEIVNQAAIPRNVIVARIAKAGARIMRKAELYNVLTWAKRCGPVNRLLYKKYLYENKSLLTPTAKSRIDAVVLEEIEKLETLLGRTFDGWRDFS
ncbi:MAG: hypothetical protein CVU64_07870 [Deltaproteobacteria bacterium HGW-Deltaproteobacteria-21]|nr:MAG: hypothetical protein CVU64_07870 [Deltaproteobacteria bacterium HGW-Deltaproteobacteria-21]